MMPRRKSLDHIYLENESVSEICRNLRVTGQEVDDAPHDP